MTRTARALLFVTLVLLATSSARAAISKGPAGTAPWFQVGKSVSPEEKQRLQQSLAMLDERTLKIGENFPAFRRRFGAADMSGIREYLKTRMQFIVSSKVRLTIQTPSARVGSLPAMAATGMVPTNNPSLLLWIGQRWNGALPGVDGLELTGPMPAVIQLGDDFGKYFPLFGLSLLVHEARHSECPGGIDAATLEQWKQAPHRNALALAFAQNACGYSHTVCAEGNPAAGRTSCDSTFEGPYGVQYVFNRAIVKYCENCSFSERALMQLFALDAASRLPLPETIALTVNRTLDRLPELQKEVSAQELVERVVESVLTPVDGVLK